MNGTPGAPTDGKLSLDEPALFLTTQSTLPVLTSLAFAFSVGAIALAANRDWPQTDFPLLAISNKQLGAHCFGFAALMFLFATNACVRSHSWDYGALSPERIKELNLTDDSHYKDRCYTNRNDWHRFAAVTYNAGALLLLVGLAALFWKIYPVLSFVYAGCAMIFATVKAATWCIAWYVRRTS